MTEPQSAEAIAGRGIQRRPFTLDARGPRREPVKAKGGPGPPFGRSSYEQSFGGPF
jgi:hypothetical protein